MFTGLDLSMLPPALVWVVVVLYVVCGVLPDVLAVGPSRRALRKPRASAGSHSGSRGIVSSS